MAESWENPTAAATYQEEDEGVGPDKGALSGDNMFIPEENNDEDDVDPLGSLKAFVSKLDLEAEERLQDYMDSIIMHNPSFESEISDLASLMSHGMHSAKENQQLTPLSLRGSISMMTPKGLPTPRSISSSATNNNNSSKRRNAAAFTPRNDNNSFFPSTPHAPDQQPIRRSSLPRRPKSNNKFLFHEVLTPRGKQLNPFEYTQSNKGENQKCKQGRAESMTMAAGESSNATTPKSMSSVEKHFQNLSQIAQDFLEKNEETTEISKSCHNYDEDTATQETSATESSPSTNDTGEEEETEDGAESKEITMEKEISYSGNEKQASPGLQDFPSTIGGKISSSSLVVGACDSDSNQGASLLSDKIIKHQSSPGLHEVEIPPREPIFFHEKDMADPTGNDQKQNDSTAIRTIARITTTTEGTTIPQDSLSPIVHIKTRFLAETRTHGPSRRLGTPLAQPKETELKEEESISLIPTNPRLSRTGEQTGERSSTSNESETASTTIMVSSPPRDNDPYKWAYEVWKRHGLMGRKKKTMIDMSKENQANIAMMEVGRRNGTNHISPLQVRHIGSRRHDNNKQNTPGQARAKEFSRQGRPKSTGHVAQRWKSPSQQRSRTTRVKPVLLFQEQQAPTERHSSGQRRDIKRTYPSPSPSLSSWSSSSSSVQRDPSTNSSRTKKTSQYKHSRKFQEQQAPTERHSFPERQPRDLASAERGTSPKRIINRSLQETSSQRYDDNEMKRGPTPIRRNTNRLNRYYQTPIRQVEKLERFPRRTEAYGRKSIDTDACIRTPKGKDNGVTKDFSLEERRKNNVPTRHSLDNEANSARPETPGRKRAKEFMNMAKPLPVKASPGRGYEWSVASQIDTAYAERPDTPGRKRAKELAARAMATPSHGHEWNHSLDDIKTTTTRDLYPRPTTPGQIRASSEFKSPSSAAMKIWNQSIEIDAHRPETPGRKRAQEFSRQAKPLLVKETSLDQHRLSNSTTKDGNAMHKPQRLVEWTCKENDQNSKNNNNISQVSLSVKTAGQSRAKDFSRDATGNFGNLLANWMQKGENPFLSPHEQQQQWQPLRPTPIKAFLKAVAKDSKPINDDKGESDDEGDDHDDCFGLDGLKDFSGEDDDDYTTITRHAQGCACSASVFSGNDELVEFFLPKLGMACTCGLDPTKNLPDPTLPKDPTAIEHILRPWQCQFLQCFGIRRGDQLVKAHHRSASFLAKEMRKWRKKQRMRRARTVSCGMALHIWSRTCKAFVRSVRRQMADGVEVIEPPNTLTVLTCLLDGSSDRRVCVPMAAGEKKLSPRELQGDAPQVEI